MPDQVRHDGKLRTFKLLNPLCHVCSKCSPAGQGQGGELIPTGADLVHALISRAGRCEFIRTLGFGHFTSKNLGANSFVHFVPGSRFKSGTSFAHRLQFQKLLLPTVGANSFAHWGLDILDLKFGLEKIG